MRRKMKQSSSLIPVSEIKQNKRQKVHRCVPVVPEGANSAVVMTLPLPPNMSNSRRHWRVTLREKKAYWAKLDLLLAVKYLPRPTMLCPAEFLSTLFVWQEMDDDGAMSRIKWIPDWLAANGYIEGDHRSQLRIRVPEQVIDRKNQRVEVVIRALNGDTK